MQPSGLKVCRSRPLWRALCRRGPSIAGLVIYASLSWVFVIDYSFCNALSFCYDFLLVQCPLRDSFKLRVPLAIINAVFFNEAIRRSREKEEEREKHTSFQPVLRKSKFEACVQSNFNKALDNSGAHTNISLTYWNSKMEEDIMILVAPSRSDIYVVPYSRPVPYSGPRPYKPMKFGMEIVHIK